MKTETMKEYSLPNPASSPHTGVVDKDGIFWIALGGRRPATIATVDPQTGKIKEYQYAEKKSGTHTVSFDTAGNLLISRNFLATLRVWTFDMKKRQIPVVQISRVR